MKFRKNVKSMVCAAVLVAVGFLTTTAPVLAQSALIDIEKRGVLRVGMSTFVPWAMRSKEGDLIGFEIDVATKLAQDMGVEV